MIYSMKYSIVVNVNTCKLYFSIYLLDINLPNAKSHSLPVRTIWLKKVKYKYCSYLIYSMIIKAEEFVG